MQTSNADLARVYAAAYTGKTARACLAINPGTLTANSTTAQWDAAEITSQAAAGYARHVWTLAAGAYDNATGRYQGALEVITFQALSSVITGLQFDTLYVVLGATAGGVTTWETSVARVLTFSPSQVLAPGQPLALNFRALVDDIPTA